MATTQVSAAASATDDDGRGLLITLLGVRVALPLGRRALHPPRLVVQVSVGMGLLQGALTVVV